MNLSKETFFKSTCIRGTQRIVSVESFLKGFSHPKFSLLKFRKMSPQIFVTSENLTSFVYGGIKNTVLGTK